MRILALDLGTKTGWALYDNGVLTSGTWTLASDKQIATFRSTPFYCDSRAMQLRVHIESFHPAPDYIFYEDVLFAKTRVQAQLWGGFRAIVSLFCPPSKLRGVAIQIIKKFGTGSGAATKEMMIAALPPEVRTTDDNQADAYHLLRFAMKELCL